MLVGLFGELFDAPDFEFVVGGLIWWFCFGFCLRMLWIGWCGFSGDLGVVWWVSGHCVVCL